jgi:hypothetical protein
MQRFSDSHRVCALAARIAEALVERFQAELGHLSQARVLYVLSEREVFQKGWPCLAYICRPRVQGAMSALVEDLLAQFAGFEGHDPDFVVRIDAAAWDAIDKDTEPAATFWVRQGITVPADTDWAIGRERLIFHELKHTYQRLDSDGEPKCSDEDGRPVLALRPHDAEYFHDELEFYGPTVCGAVDTALAIAAGGRNEQRRAAQRA